MAILPSEGAAIYIVYFDANLCALSPSASAITTDVGLYCHVTKMASLGDCALALGQFFILLECLWSVLIVQAPNALHKLEIVIVLFAKFGLARALVRGLAQGRAALAFALLLLLALLADHFVHRVGAEGGERDGGHSQQGAGVQGEGEETGEGAVGQLGQGASAGRATRGTLGGTDLAALVQLSR